MGRNIEDTTRLLLTMAGHDERVPLSLKDKMPAYEKMVSADLSNTRIGWLGNYNGYLPMENGVLGLCEKALSDLENTGLIIEDCHPNFEMENLWQTWLVLRFWSNQWIKPFYENLEQRRLLKPEVIWEFEGAMKVTGEQLSQAGSSRVQWYQSLLHLFEDYDFLALPSAQVFPFSADISWPKSINNKKMDTYHRWMEIVIGGTLSGLPVINLPAGFDSKGRPMGIQFIGKMGKDAKLIEFAMAYEKNTSFLEKRPVLET